MKLRVMSLMVASIAIMLSATVAAQAPNGAVLLPSNPSSVDNLKLSLQDTSCGGKPYYKGNPYRVTMAQNNITVTLGEYFISLRPLCPPPGPREEIELGRLPAGNYTLTVDGVSGIANGGRLIDNYPFIVTDARALKAAPYVRLDYSGTWWDENDPGWGLFIWQDANHAKDTLLAAWFTFAPDGKTMWYTFQPAWATTAATTDAALLQSTRSPGASSPPAGPTTSVRVGTASLDFTANGAAGEGKLAYTLGTGAQQVRTIKRFKP